MKSYMRGGSKWRYTWKAIDQWAWMIPQRLDEARDKIAEKRVEDREYPFSCCPYST